MFEQGERIARQLNPPKITEDAIGVLYQQYNDRYKPVGTPDPKKDNNLAEFFKWNLSTQKDDRGNPIYGNYGPDDIGEQSFENIVDSFVIDNAIGSDLDNIGSILHQARPSLIVSGYMRPQFLPSQPGTPWGGDPVSGDNPFIPNYPWFFPGDPVDISSPVSDEVYRRALRCVSYKYFGEIFSLNGMTMRNWQHSTITNMVVTLFILMKTKEREDFQLPNITFQINQNNILNWTINFENIGTITENDSALITWINPNNTHIWSKMAGLSVAFPQIS